MPEFIHVELVSRDFFQPRDESFDLLSDANKMIICYVADVSICGNTEGRNIQLL